MWNELVTEDELDQARKRWRIAGGRLADHLIELGFVDATRLRENRSRRPLLPKRIEETGLKEDFLINLLLKFLLITEFDTVPKLARGTRLTGGIVERLLESLKRQRLVEVLGAANGRSMILRYTLTAAGEQRAESAMKHSGWIGPAPVTLAAFTNQVERQGLTEECISPERVSRAFQHLVLTEKFIDQMGSAVNFGKSILLYGPSGNGKTSVAEALGDIFEQEIYLPHAVEVDSQVIRLFDPSIHREMPKPVQEEDSSITFEDSDSYDRRWVRCRRPLVISGGELSLKMLDLEFDRTARFYEAPLQLKATGGIYLIDDFGRQLVDAVQLLNRWIVPLDRRSDFLTLHTGKKFQVPFDVIVIFSTNMPPADLVDTAMLRRIPYKIEVGPPSRSQYLEIFERVSHARGFRIDGKELEDLIDRTYREHGEQLAAYHPKFIVEHILALSNYHGADARTYPLEQAIEHLFVSEPASSPDDRQISPPQSI